MKKLTLSRHAQQRRKQMKVTENQLATVVGDPELCYPGSSLHTGGRRVYQRGSIVVVMQESPPEVVTVLWHRKESRESS